MTAWLGLWGALASAAIPAGVRPAVVPPEARDEFAAWSRSSRGTEQHLACTPRWSEAVWVCFQLWGDGSRRWITTRDLAHWEVDAEQLDAWAEKRAEEVLGTQPEKVEIPDMEAHYWVAAEGDGWAAAGLLRPDLLARRMGQQAIRVAMPTSGTLLAWRAGSDELDQVMAVGVRRIYENETESVSPVVYHWEGGKWLPFGEAVPTSPK